MGNVIQIKRGASGTVAAATLQPGELALDTTNGYLYYGDSNSTAQRVSIGFGYVKCTNTANGKLAYFNSNILAHYSSTVGGTKKPIYISSGTPTASDGTEGSATKGVYLNSGTLTACTYEVKATVNAGTSSGTASTLAYYSAASTIGSYTTTKGSSTKGIYLNAGVPTACSYSLSATVNEGSAASRLAYYSATTTIGSYNSSKGDSNTPIYLNAGVPTAISRLNFAKVSSAYYNAPNKAPIYFTGTTNTSSYYPCIDIKVKNGDWAIGSYDSSAAVYRNGNALAFFYNPDTNTSSTNTETGVIGFSPSFGVVSRSTGMSFRHYHSNGKTIMFGVDNNVNRGIWDSERRWLIFVNDSGFLRTTISMTSAADGTAASFIPISNFIEVLKFISSGSNKYVEVTLSGNQTTQGITTWDSDIRLKDNIKPTELKALPIINSLKHYSFDWKEEDRGSVKLGYIAQQVEEVIPQSTFEVGEEKYLNIAPGKILPYLSKAIQELSTEVDVLKKRIIELGG